MYLALDLSTRCGAAFWAPGWDAPRSAVWLLPGGNSDVGWACAKLYRCLADHHRNVLPVERVVFEQQLTASHMQGFTNAGTLYLLAGLAAHVESFARAIGAKSTAWHQGTWRKHFIGKGAGLKTDEFKRRSVARCHELGWSPKDHNAADALGLLDFALDYDAIVTPPWRDGSIFRQQFSGARE